ncbi:hypothetical protein MNBD_BACTEROID04-329, partial [hydrothermal vent metagenome]
MKVREKFIVISVIILVVIGFISISWKPILWSLVLLGPLILVGVYDI